MNLAVSQIPGWSLRGRGSWGKVVECQDFVLAMRVIVTVFAELRNLELDPWRMGELGERHD